MPESDSTVGRYLAARLEQIGLKHYFTVPGDYNLVLLDELLSNKNLQMISCCNELNAGYAADGYSRAINGPSAAVVTYSVGGLSLLNAVAGAYAEDLPMIAISGGPNTNSTADYELLHHTLGKIDYRYQRDIFDRVAVAAFIVQNPADAPSQIDRAISTALHTRKPVYLEIACNIANATVSAPHDRDLSGRLSSDPASLAAAVSAATERLDAAVKPVLVAGVKIRPAGAIDAFAKLAEASEYGVAIQPNAKGLFDEQHRSYMGVYWGPVSSPGCGEIVESSDLQLLAGPVLTDYTTTGHSLVLDQRKNIRVHPDSVSIGNQTYNHVAMADFLSALAERVKPNDKSVKAFERIESTECATMSAAGDDPLTTKELFERVQALLGETTTVIAETGDSWFNGINLNLPSGSRFEIQMQYGSIGWSVGATLGYCVARPKRRVIACIGDGSFQLTAQEVSTMVRYGARPIIFLINNGGYTIEVEIHDGPYNTIKNWDYAGLMEVFNAGEGNALGVRVTTTKELDAAIAQAQDHDGPVLIEVKIHRDDCSKNLLKWGAHVAQNNGRPARSK